MSDSYGERKIVCVVGDDLEPWQAMNVIGHLAIGLGANRDEHLMGRPVLFDASGIAHTGIAQYGFIIKKASVADVRKLVAVCRDNTSVRSLDFPREMLETTDDDALANALAKKAEQDIEYLGVILYGQSSVVQALTKQYLLWS